MKSTLFVFLLSAGSALAGPAALKVFPESVTLDGQRDRQQLVIQAVDAQGHTTEVGAQAKWTFDDSKLVKRDGQRLLPVADGKTRLVISYQGKKVEVPVSVKHAGKRHELSFRKDVMPVFMRAGCNTGACHGSSRGQDGFRLSLFGYDPEGDHFRITQELIGRRVDLGAPEKSLLLEKAIGAVSHTGGEIIRKDSEYFKTLQEWIESYCPNDAEDVPYVQDIRMLPEKMVFRADGDAGMHRTVVMGTYSDGRERDVTHLAVFMTNEKNIADINDDGVIKIGQSGGTHVFARFDKLTVGAEVTVLPAGGDFSWPDVAEHNYIDGKVHAKLKKLHMLPSELCSDEAFLRRAYIDLVGLPPSSEEYHAFMADESPAKRSALIDELLERKEFVDLWAMKWGEILMIKSNRDDQYGRHRKAAFGYYQWVRTFIEENRPVNEMARELVMAKGSNFKTPQVNFYTTAQRQRPDAKKHGENVAQIFLGIRTQCAQCHNHPFDRWTMDDYYGFTSFFSGLGTKKGGDGREQYVRYNVNQNTVEHPVDGRPVKPKFLGGELPDIEGQDPRVALAEWISSPDNELFSRSISNRIWAHFFGRGIIEPVDDIRISNPPSNSDLLEELRGKLVESKFDLKKMVRDICNSRTYQLSSTANATNERDDRFFSRSYVRRMQAEVLADTIAAVTEVPNRWQSAPQGMRAVELFEGGNSRDYFLETFGQSSRASACACEISKEATLSQTLHLLNGDTVNLKFRYMKVIAMMIKEQKSPYEIIEELYVRALSRKPTGEEMQRLTDIIGDKPKKEDFEDILWGLMNSTEFAFNH